MSDLKFLPHKIQIRKFAEEKVVRSCSFRCDQIQNNQPLEYGHTLLFCLSLTLMFNKTNLRNWFVEQKVMLRSRFGYDSKADLWNESSCLAQTLCVT